jgi:hypothetical protein
MLEITIHKQLLEKLTEKMTGIPGLWSGFLIYPSKYLITLVIKPAI